MLINLLSLVKFRDKEYGSNASTLTRLTEDVVKIKWKKENGTDGNGRVFSCIHSSSLIDAVDSTTCGTSHENIVPTDPGASSSENPISNLEFLI